jgi:aromatic-L-amino-acid/L-tryptophan decarboxylase
VDKHVNKSGATSGDVDVEEFRRIAHQTADWIADYLRDVERYPVLARVTPGHVRRSLPSSPPAIGEALEHVIDDVDRLILPATTHWNSPGFLAYFASTGSAPGIVAEMLAAALNVNAMLWRTAPAATELEVVVLDWLRQMVGLPEPLFGVINDTASSSTLYALAAARDALQAGIHEKGMAGRDDLPRLRVYASAEAHSSVDKAAIVLGLGTAGICHVATDTDLRMDADALRRALDQDLASGIKPCAVIATVGTTSTAAIDPVPAIADVCAELGLWLHVDAAYAGAAAVAPEFRWIFDGVERADSIVVNPHKWLFTPIDCSVLWTRRDDALRNAFTVVPEYLRTAESANPDAVDLMDYGVSLGRRFRALKLWFVIRAFGTSGLADRVREHCRLATELAGWVRQSSGFELLAPVSLGVVCLRAHPHGIDDEQRLDTLNENVLARINDEGHFFLSHTRVHGRYAMRVAFGNLRTREAHVRALCEALSASLAPSVAM